MKKIQNNKFFKNYISLIIPFFCVEVLFRILSKISLLDWAMLRIFIGCNIFSILIALICQFCSEKTSKVLITVSILAATIYAIMQAGFENYIGVYISFGTSSQLGAVKEYVRDYFDSFNNSFYFLLIIFVIYLIYKAIFEKKLFSKYFKELGSKFNKRYKRREFLIGILILLILIPLYKYTLTAKFMQNELQMESNIVLFKNPSNPNISVNQFGISTFGVLDITTTLFKTENDEVIDFARNEEVEEVTDYSRIFDDTNWINLNQSTANNNYKTLNNYFMNRDITPKNDYTGMFEGKNLIVIMMESVNEIIINPEYYPTFYKMYTEGWSFSNSYSPRNSCSTGNNEMSGMISLFSIYRTCTANNYKNNQYFESMFNLFNNAGYQTSSYHNYTEKYYYRSTIHKNMGSNAYYGVTDLGISYNEAYEEWPSDVLLFERAMEHIDTENPFMAWMTTVTSHQPYYLSSEMGNKYLDMFADTNYPITLKRYMSKLKELDNALARLLEMLDEKGVLDDTVIVMYGDHYPYGLSNSDINLALPYNVNEKNNVDKTPFVIYNSELSSENFKQYTSYMNITPTIANLFNLDYDPRLYVGEDILSPIYVDSYKNRVVLADGSWENDIASYSSTSGKMTYFGDTSYTNEEVVAYNQEINNMIKMSNLAITTDYFKYLKDGLDIIGGDN